MSSVRTAHLPADIDAIRMLFREYVQSANAPACFAGFEAELAALPGAYAPPGGCLLLAGEAEGCVGLRRLDSRDAEIKRLYVRAAHRGKGLGAALARAAIESARRSGAQRVVLDTLPAMVEAQALYRRLGFRETAPYLAEPTPGALCFALSL